MNMWDFLTLRTVLLLRDVGQSLYWRSVAHNPRLKKKKNRAGMIMSLLVLNNLRTT